MRFQDQCVIVTGASRGIGKAISSAFLNEGAKVIGTYRSDDQSALAFLDEAKSLSGTLELKKFDVSDYAQVENFFKEVEQDNDRLDVLVNNSGIRRDKVLAMLPEEDWSQVIATNLTGSYHMSKFAVQNMMRARYGRIVNITSPMAHMGFAGQTNYSASKAGQVGMMKSLSKEVATRGITVNCVSPGFIETELLSDLSEKQNEEYKKLVPMKRFGRVEEVASAVLYLASKEASYISGSTLEVSGAL